MGVACSSYFAVASDEYFALAGVNFIAGEGIDLELLNSEKCYIEKSVIKKRNAPSKGYHRKQKRWVSSIIQVD
jgi:hypothetical protein